MHVKIAVLIRYSSSKKSKIKRGRESNAVCKGKYYLWILAVKKKDNRHIKTAETLPAGKGNGMYKNKDV